jgi:glycosyltransferase involved in cell wall biosynthesis
MRLLINTASTFKGGGVQVARSFIEELKKFSEHEYHVVLGEAISKTIITSEYPSNFHFYTIPYRPATRVFSFKGSDTFFKDLEDKVKPDCVFTTSGPAYWRPRAPHVMGYNLPHYIYKDSPFFKTLTLYKRLYWMLKGQVIKYFVKRDADAYVVQTDDVNQRLKHWIGRDKIYTVTNTFGSHFLKDFKDNPSTLPAREAGEFRLLMLSAWYKHKNFSVINQVSKLIEENKIPGIKFVLTLPEESFENHFTAAAKKHIYNIGPVKPDECPALYRDCDGIFLPTLLECFSATYAEAMVMNKPIITSDLGFAHTVCGPAALYVNPVDPQQILDAIVSLKDSEELQTKLAQNGKVMLQKLLTARERADHYLNICNALVSN